MRKVHFLIFLSCFIGLNGFGQNATMKPKVANTYALIVGVSEYQYPDIYEPLDWADDDGREFYNYLIKSNYKSVKPENVDTLFNKNATAEAILTKIIEFKEKLKDGDVFYFYFSGHGDAYDAELAFLLAYDAPPGRGGKEKNHYLVGSGVVDVYKIKQIFRRITDKNVTIVFISDACRTNELAGGVEGKQSVYKKIMEEDAGEIRFTSCSSNERSYEGAQWGGGRGLFSYHFVNGLIGLADLNNDGKVRVEELDRYVTDSVKEYSRISADTPPRQRPQMGCSFEYCEDQILNYVDPVQKNNLLVKLSVENKSKGLMAAKGKGLDLENELKRLGKDELYREFTDRLNKKILTGNNSAYETFQLIENDPAIDRAVKTEMKNLLCSYLNNSVNQLIYAYLDGTRKYRDYSKEYFMKAYNELLLYSQISDLYEYNKSKVDANLLFLLGHSYFESERTADLLDGLSLIDSAIFINPNAAYIYNIKARYHYQLHQFDKTISSLHNALKLAPNWVTPLTNLGVVYSGLGQKDSSFYYVKRSLALDTNYISTYKALYDVYNRAGVKDSALYYLEKGLIKDPQDTDLWCLKGNLLNETGKADKAILCYYTSFSLDPKNNDAYAGALKYHIENGVNQDSMAFYMKKMLLSDSTKSSSYRYIGQLLYEYEQYPIALSYYNMAYSKDTLNPDTFIGFGDIYWKLNSLDTAVSCYLYAAILDPGYAVIYNRLGNLSYYVDNLPAAISYYSKAHKIDPWSPVYTSGLGKFYMESKDYGNAATYYKKHLEQYTIDEDTYRNIVRCLSMLNDQQEAIRYLKIGSEKTPDQFLKKSLKKDKMLQNLKRNKEYKKILKSLKK